jgi:hypothetical protein
MIFWHGHELHVRQLFHDLLDCFKGFLLGCQQRILFGQTIGMEFGRNHGGSAGSVRKKFPNVAAAINCEQQPASPHAAVNVTHLAQSAVFQPFGFRHGGGKPFSFGHIFTPSLAGTPSSRWGRRWSGIQPRSWWCACIRSSAHSTGCDPYLGTGSASPPCPRTSRAATARTRPRRPVELTLGQ